MRVLVTGASGFIGRHLTRALSTAAHDVVAVTRRPTGYSGPGTPVYGDVDNPATLGPALRGCDVAVYLVHSLDHRDFRRRDAAAARAFGAAAAASGVGHIVYLGALADARDNLSQHLRSRRECEALLAEAGVPVTTLRAGIVIGDTGTSWEIIRALVRRVPALVVPSWASTRTQPIAVADVVRYLVGVVAAGPRGTRSFDVGGAEVLTYTEMLSRCSAAEGRPSLLIPVPMPSVRLAALASASVLPVLAGVDRRTVRALVESMRNEVVVRDAAIRSLLPFQPMDYNQAVAVALRERAERLATSA